MGRTRDLHKAAVAGSEGKQKRELLGRDGGGSGVPRFWAGVPEGAVGVIWEGLGKRMGEKRPRKGKAFQRSFRHSSRRVLELSFYSFTDQNGLGVQGSWCWGYSGQEVNWVLASTEALG